jgi:hypothetical protein
MQWGLLGIAWAYMLGGYLCLMYPTWSLAGRLINLHFVELLKNVTAPFCCAACMAAIIWISNQWLFVQQAEWFRLVAYTFFGVVIYGFLITHFKLEAWQDIKELILMGGGQRSRLIRSILGNGPQVGSE